MVGESAHYRKDRLDGASMTSNRRRSVTRCSDGSVAGDEGSTPGMGCHAIVDTFVVYDPTGSFR